MGRYTHGWDSSRQPWWLLEGKRDTDQNRCKLPEVRINFTNPVTFFTNRVGTLLCILRNSSCWMVKSLTSVRMTSKDAIVSPNFSVIGSGNVVSEEMIEEPVPINQIKILPYKEKKEELIPKLSVLKLTNEFLFEYWRLHHYSECTSLL